jgi:hypothetical protein
MRWEARLHEALEVWDEEYLSGIFRGAKLEKKLPYMSYKLFCALN